MSKLESRWRGRASTLAAGLWRAVAMGVERSTRFSALLGAAGYAASMSPSLLPRTWLFQGIITGVSVAAWAGAGAVLDKTWAGFSRWSGTKITVTRPGPRKWLRRGWAALVAAVIVLVPLGALGGQRHLADSMGMAAPSVGALVLGLLLAAATFAGILALWHGLGWLSDILQRRMRRLPRLVTRPLAGLLVILLVVGVVQYLIVGGVTRVVSIQSEQANETTRAGVVEPTSPLLSGGPGSLEAWDSLGYEGRSFVASARTRAQIEAVTGTPAMDPIRAYAGRSAGRSIEGAAAAVVAELDRTKAWDRQVLVLITTTGQGWVNNWGATAVEYLTGGNCALAAIQHSTLPSPLALLDASNRPREAGRAVLEAVSARLAQLPAGHRPKVYVSGESLGAYGGNAAFSSLDDLLARVDGAVWTGTPTFTDLHRQITAARVVGSTQVNPVVDNGRHVRFASKPAELSADQFGRPLGAWEFPRVVYVQHPSDPVVWWSPDLLVETPPWLAETRVEGPAVAMSWLPVVTFWQVTGDMPAATEVPSGYGHNYRDELVPVWAAVLDRGSPAQVEAIIHAIRNPTPS